METNDANVGYTISVSSSVLVLIGLGICAFAAPRFLSALK